MTVVTNYIQLKTRGNSDMADITGNVNEAIESSGISEGIVTVFVPGSTGAVSTVEYEPGLLKDIPKALERIAPSNISYDHNKTWGCDNGLSHVKATLMGPSLTVPFTDGRMMLGTWQQVVFLDLDTRGRDRKLILQIMGDYVNKCFL